MKRLPQSPVIDEIQQQIIQRNLRSQKELAERELQSEKERRELEFKRECRRTAMQLAERSTNKDGREITKEANKIYQWLIDVK